MALSAEDQAFQASLQAEYERLCVQVGHLFISFARLEGVLSSILRLHMANALMGNRTSAPTSKADMRAIETSSVVYGSLRFAAARDTIKRLMALDDLEAPVRETIDKVFMQLGEIQSFRDKIAHHQMFSAYEDRQDYWYLSDIVATRSLKNAKFYVLTSLHWRRHQVIYPPHATCSAASI